jgi:hypothetical protein
MLIRGVVGVFNNEEVHGKDDGNTKKNQAAYREEDDGGTASRLGPIRPIHGLLLCEEARLS